MKKLFVQVLKILKWTGISVLSLIVLFFAVRFVGQRINDRTPKAGINESMYVEINGTKQWITIYGEDLDNPVLLYLHGGPGSSASQFDYAVTRKWADVYTVVTWDQRNCGKSYSEEQNETAITHDIMMSDGVEITKFILQHLGKERLTLLGHSWGSIYGANLSLEHPEYYDCFIGSGQLIDFDENEKAFKEECVKWVGDDKEGQELLNALTPPDYSIEHLTAKNILMDRYGYGMFADAADYNMMAAQIFNPYYSISDFINLMNSDQSVYVDFLCSDEFSKFSLADRTEYRIPYYNINGDRDYQCNYLIAQKYFDMVEAPYKKMYLMKDTTHGLLLTKSDEFSDVLHEIAEIERSR